MPTPENRRGRGREQFSIQRVRADIQTGMQAYNAAEPDDLDARAEIINTQLVRADRGVALPESVDAIASLVVRQQTGQESPQYRSDAVMGLTDRNLVAIINGAASDEEPDRQPALSGALARIQAAGEESQPEGRGEKINPRGMLLEESLGELAERLNGDEDNTGAVAALNGLSIDAILRITEPEHLGAILDNADLLSNNGLRAQLERIKIRVELDEYRMPDPDEE